MLPPSRLALLVAAVGVALAGAERGSAACEKSVVVREDPDGRKIPNYVVRCDESQRVDLLEAGAHLRLCDPKALAQTGTSFEDCAGAVDAARTALRRAKIRAALREGRDEQQIAERYGATPMELEALRPVELAP